MAQVLEKSSNIGAIQVGLRVGEQNMYDYARRFGFGQQTGLPLPAESAGMLRKLKRWGSTSLASIAMGHEISTTSMQLARACSVIANGGLLVEPRLVLRSGGEPVASKAPKRIIRPETAITMRRIMEGVVLRGTGKGARLDGYTSGGKTGTAQIFDFATRHYTHLYNASFMGFAPVTNPAVVVVVTLIGTSGSAGYGGTVAAPVFRAVTTEALRVLEVPKDLPDVSPAEPEDTRQDLDDVAIAGLGTPDPAPTPDAATAEQVRGSGVSGPASPGFSRQNDARGCRAGIFAGRNGPARWQRHRSRSEPRAWIASASGRTDPGAVCAITVDGPADDRGASALARRVTCRAARESRRPRSVGPGL